MATKRGRTFLFELDDEERSNPAKKVKFLERIPAIRKHNDAIKNEELEHQRESFGATIDLMWRHPDLTARCFSWLQQRVQMKAAEATANTKLPKMTTLKSIDKTWLSGFICRKLDLDLQVMETASKEDPDTLVQIVESKFNMAPSLRMVQCLEDVEILGKVFEEVQKHCGTRFAGVTNANVISNVTGMVDWGAHGPFTVKWSKNMATSVVHRPTGDEAAIPSHVSITKAFGFSTMWSEEYASADLAPASYNLKSFFASDAGPWKHTHYSGNSNVFNALVNGIAQSVHEARQKQAQETNISPSKFMAAAAKDSRAKHMKAAQEALVKRRNDVSAKRTINLG